MKRYAVTLIGETPLLMHHDNLEWAEFMEKWGMDPANRKDSIPGDDRSPAFRWIGCLYVDSGKVVIPSDNLMTMLRDGGKKCPTGKRGATFKALTQSGIVVDQVGWPLMVNGGKDHIPFEPFKALIGEKDFEKHIKVAAEYGFEPWSKRGKIGPKKHVRVRPRFLEWSCSGTLTVIEETITFEVLRNILTFAGVYAGLCDWRPSSPSSPGQYGKFKVEVKKIEGA